MRSSAALTGLARENALVLERRRAAGLSASLLAGGAVVLLSLADGGFFERSWTPATVALAATAALAAVSVSEPPLSRLELVFVGGLAVLAAWQALSATWSLDATASLRDAQRGLVYVAAALALVVVGRRGGAAGLLAGVAGGTIAVAGYSLAQRAVEGPREVPYQGLVLNQPLGYANALAILVALGLVIVLGLAASRRSRLAMALAVPAGVVLATALALTSSRGGWLAGALGAVTLAVFRGAPAVARVPMLAALGLTIGGALVSPLVADPATLDRVLSDRAYYWWAAWHAIPDYAPLGSGAGTFAVLWGERAPVPRDVLDGHSLYLEALAELGPVGLIVVLTALATPMLAAMRSPPAWPVGAAAGAYGAFLVHAGLDWDWEMPAVTIAGLACGAALLAREATARPTRVGGRSIAGGAAVLLAAAITSWALSG